MIIIKVSKCARRSRKLQPKVVSAPRSIKIVKTRVSQEEKSPETVQVVRQIRRPRNAAAALLAWNSLFQTGVA